MRSSPFRSRHRVPVASLLSFAFLVAAPGVADAETRHVAVGGSASGDCVTTPCASVQRAVDQAGDGDTVSIGAGSFTGQTVVDGKDLELVGSGPETVLVSPVSPVDAPFSVAGSTHRPVVAVHAATAAVRDLTIDGMSRGGSGSAGFAGIASRDADLAVSRVRIAGVRQSGGAIPSGIGVVAQGSGAPRAQVSLDRVEIDRPGAAAVVAGEGVALGVYSSTLRGDQTGFGLRVLPGSYLDAIEHTTVAVSSSDIGTFGKAVETTLGGGASLPVEFESNRIHDNAIAIAWAAVTERARFNGNAFVDNASTLANATSSSVDLSGSWWGSDAGPDLSKISGSATTGGWATLEAHVTYSSLSVDDTFGSTVSASLTFANVYRNRVYPPKTATFTTNLGELRVVPEQVGTSLRLFRTTEPGVATVTATVDHQTATATVAFPAAPILLLPPEKPRPVNVAPPTIGGTARYAQTLTCQPGGWTGATSLRYRWTTQDGTSSGSGAKRKLRAVDGGRTLICEVTARNASGTTVVASAPIVVPPAASGKVSSRALKRTLVVNRSGQVRVPIACQPGATCTISGSISTKPLYAGSASVRTPTLHGRFANVTLPNGAERKVTVRLSRAARKRVRAAGGKGLLLMVNVRTTCPYGTDTGVTQAVRLRAG